MKYDFLNDEEQIKLKIWHGSLDKNRGDRARLRRGESPEDILLTQAFFNFLQEMPEHWQENKPIFVSAAVAGVLSQVKDNKQIPSKVYESKDIPHAGTPADFPNSWNFGFKSVFTCSLKADFTLSKQSSMACLK